KKVVVAPEAPAAVGPYAQAVRAGGLLFLSGQIPLDPQTGEVPEGIEAQTRRVLENIKAVLKAEGLSLADLVKTTIFLTDINDFAAVNQVYGAYFPDHPPARSTVAVQALPRGVRVEIEAVAVYPAASS
ncbi:MAG: RidA family protein, partial [Bacillota bacterium]|nr:RidA family protein [Bacillota bacterium]